MPSRVHGFQWTMCSYVPDVTREVREGKQPAAQRQDPPADMWGGQVLRDSSAD